MTSTEPDERGFTLIEAMVALVILGVAAGGIVRAAEAHVDTMFGLERRAAAQWVAENALAEAGLQMGRSASASEVTMLGWRWSVRTTHESSDDPDLSLTTVQVRLAGARDPLVTLRGFADTGRTTP